MVDWLLLHSVAVMNGVGGMRWLRGTFGFISAFLLTSHRTTSIRPLATASASAEVPNALNF